jgi:hypothetical protein
MKKQKFVQGWARNLKNVAPQEHNAICKSRVQYAKRSCAFKLFEARHKN